MTPKRPPAGKPYYSNPENLKDTGRVYCSKCGSKSLTYDKADKAICCFVCSNRIYLDKL